MNSYEEVQVCTGDTFQFHGPYKTLPKMLIRYLPFVNAHEDQYAPLLVGNARIIYEEIKEWQAAEKKPHRLFLLKLYLVGLFIYFFDSNFREHGNYLLHRLIERRAEFVFPPHHLDPETWGEEGGRKIPGVIVMPEAVAELTDKSIILKGPLSSSRTYVLQIRGSPDYIGINGPCGLEIGDTGLWIYPVTVNYGPDRRNLIIGETKKDWEKGMVAAGQAVRTG